MILSLTEWEWVKALKGMEPDISPGTDGSPLQAFSPDQLSKVKLKDIEPDKAQEQMVGH